jgi:AraC-like DNA-binding protein
MKVYIKNMIINESKLLVEDIVKYLKINHTGIEFEFININEDVKKSDIELFEIELKKYGLEIITDNDEIMSERVKNIIYELYNSKSKPPRIAISKYLERLVNYDYNYIANLFKRINGYTIQSYTINIKIDKVKKILKFNNLNMKEIVSQLNYSSSAHLSYQFKKITGITITKFKYNISLARLNDPSL